MEMDVKRTGKLGHLLVPNASGSRAVQYSDNGFLQG